MRTDFRPLDRVHESSGSKEIISGFDSDSRLDWRVMELTKAFAWPSAAVHRIRGELRPAETVESEEISLWIPLAHGANPPIASNARVGLRWCVL